MINKYLAGEQTKQKRTFKMEMCFMQASVVSAQRLEIIHGASDTLHKPMFKLPIALVMIGRPFHCPSTFKPDFRYRCRSNWG